jgi:hypothetical protein
MAALQQKNESRKPLEQARKLLETVTGISGLEAISGEPRMGNLRLSDKIRITAAIDAETLAEKWSLRGERA